MRKLRRFLDLPFHEKALFVEAVLWLGLARLCIICLPFRWFAGRLGIYMAETLRTDFSADQMALVNSIRRNVPRAARHVPWKAACLPQSIAAKVMLGRRGIPSTLYFGVRKSSTSAGIDAHAWVRAGIVEVTPRGGPGNFEVVAVFG